MARWRDDGYFPPSRPLKAEGGVKARSRRGAFAQNWWAQRWIHALEALHLGARLARGRSYARGGQVLDVEIAAGVVHARVQGSRPTPYRVVIRVKPLSPADWRRVAARIGSQAVHAAKLLAGEMPPDMERIFAEANLTLFPGQRADLATECSCPDWSNPCKHVAAVYYLVGEQFDRDPFLIFRLRGLERSDLVALVEAPEPRTGESAPWAPAEEAADEPLAPDPGRFWRGGPLDLPELSPPRRPSMPGALLKSLGDFPFWRHDVGVLDALAPVYDRACDAALALAQGDLGVADAGGAPPGPDADPPAGPGGRRGKSRDRAALEADLAAGVPVEQLRRRYDGRVLRPFLHRLGDRPG